MTTKEQDWTPEYSRWRHGGWYVSNISYPSGACGCVSNNYPDKKWRIACDDRRTELGGQGDYTFQSRDAAAKAEHELVRTIEAQSVNNRSEEIKTEYLNSLRANNAVVVKEGAYSGLVTEVTGGVVTQKINREGDVVKHEIARLNKEVKAGDVLDISYRDGMGAVKGKDKAVGVER